MKRFFILILLTASVLVTAGCGRKQTGSELLDNVREAIKPAEKPEEPAAQETEEGTVLFVYSGDDNAENIVRHTVTAEDATEQSMMAALKEMLGIDEKVECLDISFGTHGGKKVVLADMNQAFADCLGRMGTAGEYIVMGSLTDTFLEYYQCECLLLTVEGKVLETGHSVYDEYLEMYPYVEEAYRVTALELEGEGIRIRCPQIEGLANEQIQDQWNRIMEDAERRAMEDWDGGGTYTVSYTVKTMTADMLSILMDGSMYADGAEHPYSFKYTYNIDLNTGKSIRLKDLADVDKVAEDLFEGKGYYVEESLAPYFTERLEAIYENPESLARSLEGYDYSEDGSAPYGYSYIEGGRVRLCMEMPHELGDYIEVELDNR